MHKMNVDSLGRLIRRQRRMQKLRQSEVASLAGVGTRFLSELENGKESLELGRVIRVLNVLGMEISIDQRGRYWTGGSDGL